MTGTNMGIPEHFFNICDTADEVAPAYGAVLEVWNCGDIENEWTFVACGKDLSPPEEELKMIEVSPSCATRQEQLGNENQLIYPEYRPSRKVEVSEFEVELDFTARQFFKFKQMFKGRKVALWRIVGTDEAQTFFLWKGFVQAANPSFPDDEEAVATITLKVRPSGQTFYDQLRPDMS